MTAPVPREHKIGPAIACVNGVDGQEMTAPEGAFSALHYEKLVLELNGNVIVSGGTANATVSADAPESIVKRIQIILTGTSGDAFIDIPLTELRYLTHFITRAPGLDNERSAPVASVGTNPFSARVVLPFMLEDMEREAKYRGFWASNRFTGVRFKVTWGTIANLMTGGDRTNTVDPATTSLQLWGKEYSRDSRFAQATDLLLWQRTTKDFYINNIAQSDFDMEIQRTASWLKGIMIRQMTIVAGVETALADTLIRPTDKVTLMFDDSDKKFEFTWSYLKFRNREEQRISLPTGTAWIDLSEHGDMQLLEMLLNHTKTYVRIDNAAIANGVVRLVTSKYANHP